MDATIVAGGIGLVQTAVLCGIFMRLGRIEATNTQHDKRIGALEGKQ